MNDIKITTPIGPRIKYVGFKFFDLECLLRASHDRLGNQIIEPDSTQLIEEGTSVWIHQTIINSARFPIKDVNIHFIKFNANFDNEIEEETQCATILPEDVSLFAKSFEIPVQRKIYVPEEVRFTLSVEMDKNPMEVNKQNNKADLSFWVHTDLFRPPI